ncbi:Alcohol dehydrogenase 7 [Spatholobus suberectus]|nr:Alcohol dehydrogenase 7 [Spatholobus suberectus]
MTGGGADYCFEGVGRASLMHEAYASCRKGWGKTIVLGSDKPGSKLSLSCSEVLVNGKSLMGCLFGGLKPKSHVPILLKRYLDKLLQQKSAPSPLFLLRPISAFTTQQSICATCCRAITNVA